MNFYLISSPDFSVIISSFLFNSSISFVFYYTKMLLNLFTSFRPPILSSSSFTKPSKFFMVFSYALAFSLISVNLHNQANSLHQTVSLSSLILLSTPESLLHTSPFVPPNSLLALQDPYSLKSYLINSIHSKIGSWGWFVIALLLKCFYSIYILFCLFHLWWYLWYKLIIWASLLVISSSRAFTESTRLLLFPECSC